MDLKGLTINFLGDSITEGYGVTTEENIYHQLIKVKYNLKEAYNYGVSGTRIARQTVPSIRTKHDYTFQLRAEVMNKDTDLIVVFGGTNDYGHGDASFGDINDDTIYTFCGAVNSLINKLKNDFPKAKIVFMTPLHRLNETTPSAIANKTLEDYADALRAICKNKNIDIIDLFEINPLDPADTALVPDGLHPSDKGHEILAEVVAKELLKL